MKYATLIYVDPRAGADASPEEQAAVTAEYMALRADPACIDGAELASPDAATTVRVPAGDTLITDGPFAETKEVLGGFFIIDVQDLDAATAFAARVPAARMGGSVEVRPLGPTHQAQSAPSAQAATA